jgi:hypothetical protein
MAVSVMEIINELVEKRHSLKVKLYENHLKPMGKNPVGKWFARPSHEATLVSKDLVAALKNRTGYEGAPGLILENFERVISEALYQASDGFAVNLGPVVIRAHVKGGWDNVNEAADRKKHPVKFLCQSTAVLRKLEEAIDVECEGVADKDGVIQQGVDIITNSVDEDATIGGGYIIQGHGLKVSPGEKDKDKDKVGIFLVTAAGQAHKCNIVDNGHVECRFVVPALPTSEEYYVEVRTYAGTGNGVYTTDTMRSVRSSFSLTLVTTRDAPDDAKAENTPSPAPSA